LTSDPAFEGERLTREELAVEQERVGALVAGLDTDQRLRQGRLISSLAAHLDVGVSLLNPVGVQIDVNAAFCAMTGFTREDLVGLRPPRPYWPLEDRDEMGRTLRRLLDLHGVTSVEGTLVRKDGGRLPVMVTPTVMRDQSGAPLYAFAAIKDMSELRRAEAALRESDAMRDIAEGVARLGSWRWDLASGKITWSPHMYVLYDADVDKDFGGDLEALLDARIHPDDREKVRADLAALTGPGALPPVEWRVVHRDGSLHVIRSSAAAVRSPDGAPVMVVGYGQDVTEHAEAEAEIRRLNAELEERVVSRTEQRDAAARELEAFACSVAHDVRSPLRAIDGFSEMVLERDEECLSAASVKSLERARLAAQRMAGLLDDLLGLSRVSQRDLVRTRIDLSQLAREVGTELQAADPGRRVQFNVANDLVADADRALARMILWELLDNAWKSTSRH
jgi:PAS domain S-box-containing protein